MKKLLAIGEALIDFIPCENDVAIKDVTAFQPLVGGAPANVCGAFAKLGGEAKIITQLGNDPFGDKIIAEFKKYHIGCDCVLQSNEANTALAFVALQGDGNREFSFYRKPSADMLLSSKQIKESWFNDCFALHFCSVSLGDFPMKDAHLKAIEVAKDNQAIISFDPNVRLPLWDSHDLLKKRIHEFLPKAHIVKISDEELAFICGCSDIEQALPFLFQGDVKLVIYTKGSEGAQGFMRNMKVSAKGNKVKAIDTTGAGDGFIGSFLYQLAKDEITVDDLDNLSEEQLFIYLKNSNNFCGKSVQTKGAIASYPHDLSY